MVDSNIAKISHFRGGKYAFDQGLHSKLETTQSTPLIEKGQDKQISKNPYIAICSYLFPLFRQFAHPFLF